MLALVITSYDEAQVLLMHAPLRVSSVLSLTDASGSGPPHGFHDHPGPKLWMEFDDVVGPRPGYKPPTEADVRKIIKFGQHVTGTLLVHCAAGISRSPAAAIAVLAGREKCMTVEIARGIFDHVLAARPMAIPNPLVIALADYVCGWNGMIIEENGLRFGGKRASSAW